MRSRIVAFYQCYRAFFFAAAGIVIVLGAFFAYEFTRPPPQHLTQSDIDAAVARALENAKPRPSFASIAYEVIRPSLVRIRSTFPGSGGDPEGGIGTGVVIDEDGSILTALHLVKGATDIKVTFADGFQSGAVAVVEVPESDLALLRAEVIPDDLQPAILAGSGGLTVGDEVVAVGHPFGIYNSVSAGVVSGLGRSFKSPKTGRVMTDLIQFDAAVNPGNSGGPLLNRDGEVVGIVTSLLNPTDQEVFIGIGFAVTLESAGGALGSPPY